MLSRAVVYVFLVGLLGINFDSVAKNWEQLFDHSEYQNAKISPDGKLIAVSVLMDNKMALAVLNRTTLKAVGGAKLPGSFEVGNFYWVNNERVVIEVNKRNPWQEQPVFYGELFAVNFDGSKSEMIYGYQAGEMQTGSHIKKKKSTRGRAEIIDILQEDDKHILISSKLWSRTGERLPIAHKLNVYTGVMKSLMTSPIPHARFLTDTQGKIKAVVGTDKNNYEQLYLRKDGDWHLVPKSIVGDFNYPLSISGSGKYLYAIDDFQQDIKGIFKLNLEDHSYKNIYTDKAVDITNVEMTADGRSAFAIRVDESYPSYLILNKKLREAKAFKTLLKSFPYSKVRITSVTDKGDLYIVSVSSDIDPGSLYLFDNETNKLQLLFKYKTKFKGSDFAQMEPIKFKSSDGQIIRGYFTPAKSKDKNAIAPVVVLVHGGPASRDFWSFSSQVQYLALNGYSVLQVNYRGSTGYGASHEFAGHKAWGTTIQQDIFEAYQWLISQNKALPGKACIMGASFGAYSAIQSAAIYPDTYKCAIGNAGVYDLELILEENGSQATKSYFKTVLGTDEKQLKSMSPVNYAEKIKIPLLLAHGEKDEIAPIEHIESLREALDDANKPYEWFVVDKEGHGFYNPENQKNYMKKVVSFLDKNLM